ncbi:MAG: hypothetical protein AB7G28_09785 [Pirellulales bacterium]
MQEATTTSFVFPSTSRDVLSSILRQGVQEMLMAAIEAEVAQWIKAHRQPVNAGGHRQLVTMFGDGLLLKI